MTLLTSGCLALISPTCYSIPTCEWHYCDAGTRGSHKPVRL